MTIKFPQPTDLSGKNLSTIELLTADGILCATITGYKNIYRVRGNTITLSKDAAPYVPDPVVPDPIVPSPEDPGPSALDLKIDEIDKNIVYTELAITEIYEMMLGGMI